MLDLRIDGVNPYFIKSSNYSMWPIVIIKYNITPWMSFKKEHLMLTFLVLVPSSENYGYLP